MKLQLRTRNITTGLQLTLKRTKNYTLTTCMINIIMLKKEYSIFILSFSRPFYTCSIYRLLTKPNITIFSHFQLNYTLFHTVIYEAHFFNFMHVFIHTGVLLYILLNTYPIGFRHVHILKVQLPCCLYVSKSYRPISFVHYMLVATSTWSSISRRHPTLIAWIH